jgi:aminodeoxychorismate lyase
MPALISVLNNLPACCLVSLISGMSHFIFNGKLYEQSVPVIGAANRGLRYGDGLFETMKMLDGNIIQQADHFHRLWEGMNILQFEKPGLFTKGHLISAIKKLAAKNKHENAARIRLNIFRGDGGLYDAVNNTPNYIIETWELPPTTGLWNSNGLVAGIYEGVKKSCDTLSNIKHNNYLPYVMAALKAKNEKWNDAIILNQFGRIADSTIANIFLIKNETIITPALTEGCVAGIMRKSLLSYLNQHNFKCEESAVTTEDILDADEVFFTNSTYNLRWVQSIGNATYSNTFTQKIYSSFEPTIC